MFATSALAGVDTAAVVVGPVAEPVSLPVVAEPVEDEPDSACLSRSARRTFASLSFASASLTAASASASFALAAASVASAAFTASVPEALAFASAKAFSAAS